MLVATGALSPMAFPGGGDRGAHDGYIAPMANDRARKLRKDMSDSEWLLWSELRKRQVAGHRFRRQHPLGPYVVDFVCLEKRFVVEIDGGHHSEPEQMRHDAWRTRWLEGEGYRVFRVWNTEVFDNLHGVVDYDLGGAAAAAVGAREVTPTWARQDHLAPRVTTEASVCRGGRG